MNSVAFPELFLLDDLIERDQWILWRREKVRDRETKVPYTVRGKRASSTNPLDWAPFEEVMKVWRLAPNAYSGVGFVFTEQDPFVGIDLDDCLAAPDRVKPWAQPIVERFADTYAEISPSGTGIKIFARGALPFNLPGAKVGDGSIELYDRARYFTVTGNAFCGAPLEIEDHAADISELYRRLISGRKRWAVGPTSGRIPHGQQHNALVGVCGALRRRGVCDEAIEACLQIVNRSQCERPGPPRRT